MEHGPAAEWKKEKSESFKSRLGLIMFAAFAPIYIVFILITVINPRLMAMDVGSLNLAVVYGFGIIISAIVFAIIYNRICSKREKQDEDTEKVEGKIK